MKKKTIGWILLGTVGVAALAGVLTSAYFITKSLLKEQDPNNGNEIKINQLYNQPAWQNQTNTKTAPWVGISKDEVQIYSKSSDPQLALNKLNQIGELSNEQKQNDQGTYIEYVDPYTQIKFRDYAYYVDKENPEKNRYLLGAGGLAYLANEFKRKATFGPEVFDLEAININNFKIIPESANGLYIPQVRNIYINAAFLCETNATLYERVATIMQTLFHEYMHHWANSYAEIALLGKDQEINIDEQEANVHKKQLARVNYYEPGEMSLLERWTSTSEQYWNGYFADNFRTLLNYDIDAKSHIDDGILLALRGRYFNNNYRLSTNVSGSLYDNFTPAELWELSNGSNNVLIRKLYSRKSFWFSPDEKFALDKSDLRYYYSITELVPREYLKYAFESYYNIDEPNPANIAAQKHLPFSTGFFGNMKFNYKNDSMSYEIRPSSIADDYGKVFMNNFDSLTRQGWYITDDSKILDQYIVIENGKRKVVNVKGSSSIMMPNSPFALESYKTSDYISQENLNKIHANKSEEFYDLFLKTMGYGSTISQIFPSSEGWKWADNYNGVDTSKVKNTIKLAGYLQDKTHDGYVFIDPNTNKVIAHTKINYLDTFNFFGHKDFDKGAKSENSLQAQSAQRQIQIKNRIYADNNYVQYITDPVTPPNNALIYFWDDLNKNGIVDTNEIVENGKIELPTNRWVTSYRSSSSRNYYTIQSNSQNQITIKKN
ncbi:MYPU_1760 family metalloprotease [Mycoplasma seminis]|uniref:Uncharacterized protein n=1 Tax=Mycoplasma seminis TaxID=512749 RepID=A0ABY9HAC8_9MOLU|nr:hypothetical protein [Mycoplasma seminis]WLP85534.1 hypothetical protein Q8852_04430 [Mycoplasma seminis]